MTNIYNWTDLHNIRNNPSGEYQLQNDLNNTTPDYEGIGNNWTPIEDFTGVFQGNGYDISHARYNNGVMAIFDHFENALVGNFSLDKELCDFDTMIDGMIISTSKDGVTKWQ